MSNLTQCPYCGGDKKCTCGFAENKILYDDTTIERIAHPVKQLDWNGYAVLYKLSKPIPCDYQWQDSAGKYVPTNLTKYIIVSRIPNETFIFACDSTGEKVDFIELPGSRKGDASHAEVLKNRGYVIGERYE